ncbi:MAG: thioredoxin domain-containing protein [Candidatus Eisenbacteria bacterium]|nr:thioredoxin domain-containing protein [Candidatus Eisenbacteria bacterium]
MHEPATGEPRKPNRLIHEKSPYLLQHAFNPVDWYPWGEEAFARARRENRPIFLSIGYSTCHWCHVMERESFENDSIAALLNRDFVPIKVDREERPDVDRIYMTSMQAMGMGGGWPLNAFLTPDLKPFFGGTYFPPHSMSGRIGMMEMLPRVHQAWTTERAKIEQTGSQVFTALAAISHPAEGDASRDSLFEGCARSLTNSYDAESGGFGGAPKFPSVVNLDFLWRWWAADPTRHAHAKEMAARQLDAMRAGGIHDHLGGGFHRYSTDAVWLVPHFEKMLYDQAQLANTYLEGFLSTANPDFAAAARDIFGYVGRDLTAPAGAFYSAEDADSEGEEGRFYVWTPRGIEAVLGAPEAQLFCDAYGVAEGGNFEHGTSILHLPWSIAETARHHGLPAAECEARLARSRAALLAARAKRIRPYRDDKVLAAWNGLMISAFARGARVLDDRALTEQARRAAEFVWSHLRDAKSGALHRRWRDGEAAGAGQLDDYADLALGFLDLYQATFDPVWLERSIELTGQMVERFYDSAAGGFFESPAGDPSIQLRLKDEFDGAEIAGNSVAAEVLERLAVLLDRADWREKARRTFDDYSRRLQRSPTAMPRMIAAMLLERSTPRHIVIVGDPAADDTRALIREYDRRFHPHDVLIVTAPGERAAALHRLLPFAAGLPEKNGRATAYVCVNYACRLPTSDRAAFAAQLDEPSPAHRKEP